MRIKPFEKYNRDECWICGTNEKLTKEHKYKRTDIISHYGRNFNHEQRITLDKYREDNRRLYIPSPKSNSIKFEASICQKCNGSTTQDADECYLVFSEYWQANKTEIALNKCIDLTQVYGLDWKVKYINVLRYIAKHIGCRLTDANLMPNSDLKKFVIGESQTIPFLVVWQIKPEFSSKDNEVVPQFYKSKDIYIWYRNFNEDSIPLGISGWLTSSGQTFNFLYNQDYRTNSDFESTVPVCRYDYSRFDYSQYSLSEETLMKDSSRIMNAIECYPFTFPEEQTKYLYWMINY